MRERHTAIDTSGMNDVAKTSRMSALVVVLAAIVSGCAATQPTPYGDVLTLKASEASSLQGSPPPGTVWRLDEADLNALSPAPVVPAPPPPRFLPPPRPNAPAAAPYFYPPPPPPGYYGPPY